MGQTNLKGEKKFFFKKQKQNKDTTFSESEMKTPFVTSDHSIPVPVE